MLTTTRGLAHSASLKELDDVEKFLVERLPALGDKDMPKAPVGEVDPEKAEL